MIPFPVQAAEEDSAEPAGGPVGRLLQSVRNLLATVLNVGRTRLELLTVEFQLEAQRVVVLLLLGVLTVFSAGIALAFIAVTVIVAFWDTHRVLAALFVTGTFLGIAVVSGVLLAYRIRAKPRLLAGTLAELAEDARRLRDAP